ncbi:hypothetical protein, partial [Cyanobium sp. ATX 6A2]|uniref:hypothetical protein n=1 Tax=Cyanobium sp. ATX 6A2 TaxID=2823700 RepID=UPI0020CFBD7F
MAVALISSAMTPVALAESWKDCEFNYQPIGCRYSCQATAKTGPDATRNLAPLREPLTRLSAMTADLSPLEQSSRDA